MCLCTNQYQTHIRDVTVARSVLCVVYAVYVVC